MVMIPTDVGVQVRAQSEAGAHPVRPVGEIPSDLPALQQGQAFRARIQEVLPENSYKAVVAGRQMTLSLAEGAQADDVLDLVVVGQQGAVVIARRGAAATPGGQGEAFENARLSATGQLIASLLDAEGEGAPAASFSRGGPVLARVPENAAAIARELPMALSRAVAGSGMFYESHQVQWALGERPLSSLLREPQGGYSDPSLLRTLARAEGRESAPVTRREGGAEAGAGGAAASGTAPAAGAIPEELRSLVQQQLEAGASHRLAWHGEVWPGQELDWEIHPDDQGQGSSGEAPESWTTRLTLVLPHLGELDLRLALAGSAVGVVVRASAPSGTALRAALPELRGGLGSAGLDLVSAQVSDGEA